MNDTKSYTMFNDQDGKRSSMRIIWSISVIIVMIVWAIASIYHREFIHFTSGDVCFFTTLFGLKVGQSTVEKVFDPETQLRKLEKEHKGE